MIRSSQCECISDVAGVEALRGVRVLAAGRPAGDAVDGDGVDAEGLEDAGDRVPIASSTAQLRYP
jgi:hypothetical protein